MTVQRLRDNCGYRYPVRMRKKSTGVPHSVGSHPHDPQGRGLAILPLSTRTVSERGASRLRGVPSGLRVRRRRGAGLSGAKEKRPAWCHRIPARRDEIAEKGWQTRRAAMGHPSSSFARPVRREAYPRKLTLISGGARVYGRADTSGTAASVARHRWY